MKQAAASSAVVRFDWLEMIIGQSQIVTGKVLVADPDEARALMEMFLGALPPPVNQAEGLPPRVSLEFASRTGTMLHAQAHQGVRDAPCRLVPESVMALLERAQGLASRGLPEVDRRVL